MEASSRERLTGAVIFVAVFSIVASEMFSGRGEDAVEAQQAAPAEAGPPLATYDLALNPAAAPAAAREPVVVAPAEVAAPAEPVSAPPTDESASRDVPLEPVMAATPAAAPGGAPAATAKPAEALPRTAAAASSAGGWWVQLGSFSSTENAQRLARELRARGFQIEVAPVKVRGKDLLGVRAGPVSDREAALALKNRIGPSARDAMLVGP